MDENTEALEATAARGFADWQRWWWGRPFVFGLNVGGFDGAPFGFLKSRRARALARDYRCLSDNLIAIPASQLERVGPYWADFAVALEARSDDFAAAIAPTAERFGAGLGAGVMGFGRGLGWRATGFVRALGSGLEGFARGLGRAGLHSFLSAMGPRAGALLDKASEGAPEAALLAEPMLEHAIGLVGEGRLAFMAALGAGLPRWLELIGPAGRRRLVLELGVDCARVIERFEGAGCLSPVVIELSDEVAARLGERCDEFFAALGPRRDAMVLALGARLRRFFPHSRDPKPLFASIAGDAERFAGDLGHEVHAFALALGELTEPFYWVISGEARVAFMKGLGPQLGVFLRSIEDPRPALETLAEEPEQLLGSFDDAQLESLARDLSPVARRFGSVLGPRAERFAQALGPRAAAFGRGLRGHARGFIAGLGGRAARPEQDQWLSGLWTSLRDFLGGNHYRRGFLKALDEQQREAWFEAITQAIELKLQERNTLRCSLCHEALTGKESLLQCPRCATILHADCLAELSRHQCPNDGEPRQAFLDVRVS